MEEARFTMRIHPVIMEKMKYIAKNNGRSLNKEIEQILKWVVDDYEHKCGRITLAAAAKEEAEQPRELPPRRQDMEMLFKLEK